LKYINVYFTESAIVMKSEERNYKRNPLEGEGKMWDPKLSLVRKNKNLCTNKASMPHARVM
jgi:hypothetical protein